ncbi:MAG TPA: PilX N-terminal domain-containing pilus assembly protein [Candidatus Eisenbacteria bacterium]|nr:PilX N-terminal domain-containing pilus assembly protein [Candidatus Eisenbacteria bacterium]
MTEKETLVLEPIQGGTVASRSESGNALVVALLVLMVLTSAGVAYVAVTKSEKQIAGNTMTASQAMYAAEAGIAEGLHRMAFPAESLNYIGPATLPYPGWGKYIVLTNGASLLDPNRAALASDGLDNDGDGFVDESGEAYPEVLTKQTVNANALVYPYVRVEYKLQGNQLVRFGDGDDDPTTPPVENLQNGAPVLRITASGRRGNAAKTLEAEAVRFPIISAKGPLWAGGHMNFNGNAFLVDGHDHYAASPNDTIPGAPPAPAVLTEGPTSDATLTTNQQDNVTGDGGDNSVQHSAYTYDFNQIWTQLSGMADYSLTGPLTFGSSTPSYGSYSNPKVTVVNGNLAINGTWTGGGILMVNGNLAMGGGCQFKGIVVCSGDLTMTGGGPADVARIIGAVIYQGTLVNASTFSGSGRIWYSSEAINSALNVNRYTLAWWRER